jgi:hypothetical protein
LLKNKKDKNDEKEIKILEERITYLKNEKDVKCNCPFNKK